MIRLIFVLISGHLVSASVSRILGGAHVDISQFPHQVSLENDGHHVCGGAILSQTKILTTAHCVEGISEQELQVRAGSGLKLQDGQLVGVAKIVPHPFYSSVRFQNDIAVLILEENLTFNQNVRPVQIAPATGRGFGYATGWGETSTGKTADQLQVVPLWEISANSCRKYLRTYNERTMLCFVGERGRNVCNGDSGGPLTVNDKLVGLIAYTAPGCKENSISMQIRVSAFTRFINSVK